MSSKSSTNLSNITRANTEKEKALVEWYLLHKEQIKNAKTEPLDCGYIGSPKIDGMPHAKGKTSNPTEQNALLEMSLDLYSARDRKWVDLIEQYYYIASDKVVCLIDARLEAQEKYHLLTSKERGKGRPSWIDYAAGKYADFVERRTGREIELPAPKTILLWWDRIIWEIYVIALKKGMFD